MKSLKRIFTAIIAISFCSGIFTSCDPDDIDAFAQGYRDGYYGTRSEVSNTNMNETEDPSIQSDAE